MILYLILAAVFVILGLLMLNGKGLRLVAGLDKNAIERYDFLKLKKFMGIAMMAFVIPMLLLFFGVAYNLEPIQVIGFTVIAVWLIVILAGLNTKLLKKD